MKKLLIIATIMSLFIIISYRADATNVGGIISSNTTWTLAGSPYTLINSVQVSPDITLSIEPGCIIYGNDNNLEVWGTLNAVGTTVSRIVFNNSRIRYGDNQTQFLINLRFCEFNYGAVVSMNGAGSLILQDSILKNCDGGTLAYQRGDCYIERNIFDHCGSIFVGITGGKIYVRNNVFYNQTYPAVSNFWHSGSSELIVKYNSFLSTNKIALSLEIGDPPAEMTATENYWNTTDTIIIDSMIHDRKDDLGITNFIAYNPILTAPHPNTPIFLPNQTLTVQAQPSGANTIEPMVGQHVVSGLVNISADKYINCPDVYLFDHWVGDVTNPNSAKTTVFMDSDKSITAVFVSTRTCGDECHNSNVFGDYNHDCLIDITDFAQFALNWMNCTKPECD